MCIIFCAETDTEIMADAESFTVYLIINKAGRSTYTAKHRPWKLVWNSPPLTLTEARKLENLLKNKKAELVSSIC